MSHAKIRWGLIGTGTVAREWMIDAIRNSGDGDVVAAFDLDRNRSSNVARTWGGIDIAESVEALLATPDIDAVYISTTNETHAPLTLAAASAGKHVLCEKPMAMNLDDARSMIAACEKAGVVLGINHHLRNAASHRAMRQAIQEGRIGRPVAVRVFHAVYLPESLQTWRVNNPGAGGGVILDITVHNADTVRFLLGEEPETVTAMTQTAGMSGAGLEDGAMSISRFASGTIVQMHEGFTTRYAGTGLEIHGTEGSLFARDVMTQQPVGTVTLRNADGETALGIDHENLYEVGVRRFCAAVVRGDGIPAATGADGFASLAFALAVRESAATGKSSAIARLSST